MATSRACWQTLRKRRWHSAAVADVHYFVESLLNLTRPAGILTGRGAATCYDLATAAVGGDRAELLALVSDHAAE